MNKDNFIREMTKGVAEHHGLSEAHAAAAVLAAFNFVVEAFSLPNRGAAKTIMENSTVKTKYGSALACAVEQVKAAIAKEGK